MKLPFGGLEEYLMGLHVCPGGRHKVEVPGRGLWVERYYPQGTRD